MVGLSCSTAGGQNAEGGFLRCSSLTGVGTSARETETSGSAMGWSHLKVTWP